jgi:hypothetical protein
MLRYREARNRRRDIWLRSSVAPFTRLNMPQAGHEKESYVDRATYARLGLFADTLMRAARKAV